MKTAQGKIPMDPDISALAEEGRAIVRHEIKTQEASDDIASRVQETECYCFLKSCRMIEARFFMRN